MKAKVKLTGYKYTHAGVPATVDGSTIQTDCSMIVRSIDTQQTTEPVDCPACLYTADRVIGRIPATFSIARQFDMTNGDGPNPLHAQTAATADDITEAAANAMHALYRLRDVLRLSEDDIAANRIADMAASIERTVLK